MSAVVLVAMLGLCSVQAQTGTSSAVWRCGQLLTNQPQPGQSCELLSAVASTVVEGTRVSGPRNDSAATTATSLTAGRTSPSASRERWSATGPSAGTSAVTAPPLQQARALLQAELQEQERRWQQLHAQWNRGRPVATPQHPEGSPAYLERVGALREQLQRTEADVAALRRELARLP